MSILVTGGAGYVGSHCVAALTARGYDVAVLDDLSTGHREAVQGARLYLGSLSDCAFIDNVFTQEKVEAVIHFAACSLVGESMSDPGKYFTNNFAGTVNLLETMREHNIPYIIFSSTAAVYGETEISPITEECPKEPTNPYGESKLMVEKALKWFDSAYGIKYTALRYFNVAGAIQNASIGEDHNPETHLIPLVLQAALNNESAKIFGNDYPTHDGTCIRDYIYVMDLACAHVNALDYLRSGGQSDVFNLGIGHGYSVLEIIESARRVTGKAIPAEILPRRGGDPAVLIASGKKARRTLDWQPKYTDIDEIIQTAWHGISRQTDHMFCVMIIWLI